MPHDALAILTSRDIRQDPVAGNVRVLEAVARALVDGDGNVGDAAVDDANVTCKERL